MSKKKILVVDDDTEFVEELREMLETGGYEPVTVTDSISVMEQVRGIKPDLILLDLKMPHKSGFQIANELRHNPETAQMPIIAMTGYYTDEEHALLMNLCGIQYCLKKPFHPLDVIFEIERFLDAAV